MSPTAESTAPRGPIIRSSPPPPVLPVKRYQLMEEPYQVADGDYLKHAVILTDAELHARSRWHHDRELAAEVSRALTSGLLSPGLSPHLFINYLIRWYY